MYSEIKAIAGIDIVNILDKGQLFVEVLSYFVRKLSSIELDVWGSFSKNTLRSIAEYEQSSWLRKILFREHRFIVTTSNIEVILGNVRKIATRKSWGIIKDGRSMFLCDYSTNTALIDCYNDEETRLHEEFAEKLVTSNIIEKHAIVTD